MFPVVLLDFTWEVDSARIIIVFYNKIASSCHLEKKALDICL